MLPSHERKSEGGEKRRLPTQSIMSTEKQPTSDSTLVLRRLVGGTVGGVLQAASSHPFDTIKSRVQRGVYPTAVVCMRETFAREGLRGFYRGVTPPLFLSGVYNSILFSINQCMMNLMTPEGHDKKVPLPLWRTAIASQLTAPLYVLAITPMEVVKVKLQVQPQEAGTRLYSGPIDCVKKTVRQDGPAALLKGYIPTVLSRIVGLPFYFGAYQVAKGYLTPKELKHGEALPIYVPMLSGVAAGLFFWGSNYPFDFLKTQAQASTGKTSMMEVAKLTISNHGVKGLYRGFGACMIRSIPANSTVWIGIEFTSQFMSARGY